ADIPGLIEGASRGLGLGEEFLRHVERTRLLVHVVDASRPDPLQDIATIDAELKSYGRGLALRPQLVALNKIDLPEAREAAPRLGHRLGITRCGRLLPAPADPDGDRTRAPRARGQGGRHRPHRGARDGVERRGAGRVSSVGVFGGTFDPVHVGHLAIANAALDELGLARVYFVPARRSPLKQDGPIAGPEDRLAMPTAATAGEPRFRVSGIELHRKGPSFTVDTLEALRGE